MNRWIVSSALAILAATAACEKQSPTAPSVDSAAVGPESVLDAKTGVTLVRPQLVSPAAGATVANADQPATLVIKNGLSTGGTATYTFEVATDSAFNSKVYTKDGVAQGGN